uniref:Secreted protein n=1 Tax=Rhizophora mucronata TaxID=61149 RepID=A0A2P2IH84_RHIMU
MHFSDMKSHCCALVLCLHRSWASEVHAFENTVMAFGSQLRPVDFSSGWPACSIPCKFVIFIKWLLTFSFL